MARFLLAHGANPNQSSGDNSVFTAVEKDNLALLRLLITHGAKTTITDGKHSENALQKAAACNSIASLKFLLEHGLLVDERNTYGETALMEAARENQTDAVRFLLAHGANPNAQDKWGQTVLGHVDTNSRPKEGQRTARLLRRHGALVRKPSVP